MAWTTCQCGATLEPPSNRPAGAFRCPRCGEVVDLPSDQTAFAVEPLDDELPSYPSWREEEPKPGLPTLTSTCAFVLGLLSFVLSLATALPALLLAHLAQRFCDRDPRVGGRQVASSAKALAIVGTITHAIIYLLIPQIQRVHEPSTRMQNMNNMKQLVLAAHSFHDVNKTLPPAYGAVKPWNSEHSCFVWLLPYVEQGELFKRFDRLPKDQNDRGEATIEVFLASQDVPKERKGVTSYAGNIRVLSEIGAKTPPGQKVRRLAIMADPLSIAQIKDGASATLLFANRYAECDGVATLFDAVRPDESGSPLFGGGFHSHFADGEPQLNRTFQTAPAARNCRAEASVYGQSFHEAGIIAALCDGSVRFISKTIEPRMFQFALCPDDGQPVNLD
jgi:hypothetical protein